MSSSVLLKWDLVELIPEWPFTRASSKSTDSFSQLVAQKLSELREEWKRNPMAFGGDDPDISIDVEINGIEVEITEGRRYSVRVPLNEIPQELNLQTASFTSIRQRFISMPQRCRNLRISRTYPDSYVSASVTHQPWSEPTWSLLALGSHTTYEQTRALFDEALQRIREAI